MNAGATTERVLIALRQFLTSREIGPGDRLDPAALAGRFSSSQTPLREALHRLTGEGLLENHPNGGFIVPALDTWQLRNLYAWSGQILTIAIHNWPRRKGIPIPLPPVMNEATFAERCETLFLHIACISSNGEHEITVRRLNARLHRVRLIEADILQGLGAELDGLNDAASRYDRRQLLAQCTTYHRRRMKYSQIIGKLIKKTED